MSPFNEAKYQALLEGLEVSEVLLRAVLYDNEKFRIDSEFFMKKYISAYQKIKSIPYTILDNELLVLTDFHANGSYEQISSNFKLLDEPNYAYMVRTTDLETNNFTNNIKFITKNAYDFLSKSKVFGGELLINKIGTPGRCYLMPTLNKPVSLGMNLFLIRVKDKEYLNEKLLYTFFNTSIGQAIIFRKINGTVPLTIDKVAIKSLYVPKFENSFVSKVSDLIDLHFSLEKKAKSKYAQAEALLLEHLGLSNFQTACDPVNIKSLKESFLQTGRLDAEFYQKKYENLLNRIKEYPNGYELLNYFISDYSTGYPYKSETYCNYGIPLIRINNINSGLLDISNAVNIPYSDLNLSPKDIANEDDILISMSGTIGNSCKIPKGLKAVVNQRIMRFAPKNINSEILPLLINSIIGRYQLEKIGTGGVQTNLSVTDISSILIPKIEESMQTQIADLIQQSNALRREAHELLEQAKLMVEQHIENSINE